MHVLVLSWQLHAVKSLWAVSHAELHWYPSPLWHGQCFIKSIIFLLMTSTY